jgi:hypothetical protein
MPPNIQRYLPMLLIFAALVFILPQLTKKHSSGLSTKQKATNTQQAMNLVGSTEKSYLAAHGRYSAQVADLVALAPAIANDIGGGVTVTLDVSTDGKTYVAEAASDSLSLTRARNANKVLADSCVSLKSGATCPASG